MEFLCPICQHPLKFADDDQLETSDVFATLSSVDCPNCGTVHLPDAEVQTRINSAVGVQDNGRIAHFELIRLLGRGGFGSVWLARDVDLNREVALKLPISQREESTSLVHEARVAANLHHPNIVSVYEVGTSDDQIFIASEYIEGLTLRDVLSAGKPKQVLAVEYIAVIANALHHAHMRGVVHRDVKPSNIMINAAGQPVIMDFGLAKNISVEESVSSEGQILGTAKYMSPEQASGKTKETDHRSDIYAMGVILFEMITGFAPFRGNVRAVLHQKIYEEPPSPRSLDPNIPKDLETVCLKCLERDPSKRYASAEEVANELMRFQRGEPILARPVSSAEKLWRWCRRRPGVALLIAGLISSLTFGLVGVSYFWYRSETNAALTDQAYYRSQMRLGAEYEIRGDIDGVKASLSPFGPEQRLADLRGFEWDYLNHRLAPYIGRIKTGTPISEIAISRDGKYVAGVGNQRTVDVWETKTGRLVRTLKIEAGKFLSVEFSPINANLVTGSSDGFVRIWNPILSDQVENETKHGPAVAQVEYSPDGKHFLSRGTRGAVRIWDSRTMENIIEIPTGAKNIVMDVQFSPDGKQLAVGTRDAMTHEGSIQLWQYADRIKQDRLGPVMMLEKIEYTSDGSVIAAGTAGGTIVYLDLAGDQKVETKLIQLGAVGDLGFAHQSNHLMVVASSGNLNVYDPLSHKEVNSVSSHNLSFGCLDQTVDGKVVAVGSGTGDIKLFDTAALVQPSVLWADDFISQSAILPSKSEAILLVGNKSVWRYAYGDSVTSTKIYEADEGILTSLALRPQGDQVVLAGRGTDFIVLDLRDNEIESRIQKLSDLEARVTVSPDGTRLIITDQDGNISMRDWSDLNASLVDVPSDGVIISSAIFSPDGSEFVTAHQDGRVSFWSVESGERLPHSFEVPTPIEALCFLNGGKRLVLGDQRGGIFVWDRGLSGTVKEVTGHTARINAITAFPDEPRFITAGRDRLLTIWDAERIEPITNLYGHEKQVFSISISEDGDTVVSTGLAGDLRLWQGKK
ncbi:serine/threonine-protein kinase [Thalassoglobus sp. JC818]|uniref:serine/threonine-protein kinase n=1 Tax=Thalassoglobus sp. JC818 TaxID=3232136 RepID=UPI003458712C